MLNQRLFSDTDSHDNFIWFPYMWSTLKRQPFILHKYQQQLLLLVLLCSTINTLRHYRLDTLDDHVLRGHCVTELHCCCHAASASPVWYHTLIIINKYDNMIFFLSIERATKWEGEREGGKERKKMRVHRKRNILHWFILQGMHGHMWFKNVN